MAIAGIKAEPTFIRKPNRSPLRPSLSSDLTPLTSQMVNALDGGSMEIQRNVDDRAKSSSFLATMLETWRLIEKCRSSYAEAPPGGELQQRG
ncbi:hypothetical protein TNCV_4102941 [Trichonephila clavipes]|nr:hypothetical protein TNCV_4102941 [Trichonephila clavipes]